MKFKATLFLAFIASCLLSTSHLHAESCADLWDEMADCINTPGCRDSDKEAIFADIVNFNCLPIYYF